MGLGRCFFKKNYVALGWPDVGDLSKLTRDREAFEKRVAESYRDIKPGWIPISAGQLFPFVYELKPGDLIVYPSRQYRQVHLGRVEGAHGQLSHQ